MNLELDSIRARGARVPGRSYQVVVQVCSSCPVNTIGRWKDHACSPAANAGFSMVGGEEGEKLPGQLTSPKSRYYCSPFKPCLVTFLSPCIGIATRIGGKSTRTRMYISFV